MPSYVLYRDDIETIAPDESETHDKIVKLMTDGQNYTREKYGKAVRISHAKSHGLLKGELIVNAGLPYELAQGLFAKPGRYPVIVRMATAPGEFTDDSKLSTSKGLSIKVFDVDGPKLAPFEHITTHDFVLDTGKEFLAGNAKSFLQAFKPNAELAPKLSDNVKGAVSNIARTTNAALNAVGMNSQKLDFYGHEKNHPMAEEYYTQTPIRYGEFIAKLGAVPTEATRAALQSPKIDPQTPDALREMTVEYFKTHDAEFDIVVQLNTSLDDMSIEDGEAVWSEELSQYQKVGRLVLPVQLAYDQARADYVDGDLSFSPAHSLVEHRPLGSINRARLVAYTALSTLRRQENGRPTQEPANTEQMPA